MNVILLGAPGAGKGTVARKLAEKYGVSHISTGDVFRDNIQRNTMLGIQAKKYVDSGKLVPDQLVTQMVKSRLAGENGFILDGYPRNIAQANSIKEFANITSVINFSAPKKVLVSRIEGRRTCKKCSSVYNVVTNPPKKENICDKCAEQLYKRTDETPNIILERLSVYDHETKPLIDFYRNQGLLNEVDATAGIVDVVDQCAKILESDV